MIVLNLKTYEQTIQKPLFFVDTASEIVAETGVRIVICPPSPYLLDAAQRFSGVFAQHVDPEPLGAYTGSISAEMLKSIGVKGSLINHSEKRVSLPRVRETLERMHSSGLESIACAPSVSEAAETAAFAPTFVAVEPPELIGSGVSVSRSKPEVVTNTVKAIKNVDDKVHVLCCAGVSNKYDVKKALGLGVEGVLLASAFVKAKDPKEFMKDLASVF